MANEKFTPAPWYAVEYAGFWSIQKKDEYSRDDDLLDQEKCEQAMQNAKLAAAAPEMYNLLASLVISGKANHHVVKNIERLLLRITAP